MPIFTNKHTKILAENNFSCFGFFPQQNYNFWRKRLNESKNIWVLFKVLEGETYFLIRFINTLPSDNLTIANRYNNNY